MSEKYEHSWSIFFSIFFASSMIYFDQTILPVGLPTIQKYFFSSDQEIQWILNSYRLVIAAFVLPFGKLSDLFGLRKIFLAGSVFFGVFSILCAFSTSANMLIFFRVLQGVGAAAVIPTFSPILFASFSIKKRGFIIGLKVALSSILMALGPILGGFFSQVLNWRLIFLLNPVLAVLGLFLILGFQKKKEVLKEKIHYKEFLPFSLALTFLTLGIMQGKQWGWFSFGVIIVFVLFILFFLFFISLEKKQKEDLKLFHSQSFIFYALNVFLVQFAMATTIFFPIFFQQVVVLSPVQAGLFSMVSYLPVIFAAPISGKMADHYGAKLPLLLGHAITAISFILLYFVLPQPGMLLIFSLFLLGIGGTFSFTPAFIGALGETPVLKRGRASGILNMVRSVGMSLGIAIFGALLINAGSFFVSQDLKKNKNTSQYRAENFQGLLSQQPKVMKKMEELSFLDQNYVIKAVKSSSIASHRLLLITAFFCFSLLFFLLLKFLPKKKVSDEELII